MKVEVGLESEEVQRLLGSVEKRWSAIGLMLSCEVFRLDSTLGGEERLFKEAALLRTPL